MSQTPDFFPLGGGLDLVSPAIATPKGRLQAAVNFEPEPAGYRRWDGFERRDGRPRPSDQYFWVMHFENGTADLSIEDVVTGATSGATGVVLVAPVVTAGSFAAGTAAGTVVLTQVTGTFQGSESAGFAQVDGLVGRGAASNDTDAATWLDAAIERARAFIQKVPGSGPVRGVWAWDGNDYAFRDAADTLSGRMYKASATGWQQQDLGRTVNFTSGGVYWTLAYTSGGVHVIAPGETVTGATSAKTALVESLTVTSGSFAGGDAAGTLTLVSVSGAFVAENIDIGASLNVATIGGAATKVNDGEDIADGDVLTGATSGNVVTVGRVVVTSGAFATGTAAGRLVLLSDATSEFAAESVNHGAVAGIAAVAGPSTAQSLPPGGRYEFVTHNFYGASNLERVYGCNGVGRAFEWDGLVFTPIVTGMVNDAPDHISEFRNQLFLSFPGGSIQNSALGIPLDWSVVLGAAEIGMGSDVTNFLRANAGTLGIFCKRKISILTGNDRTDFVLTPLTDDVGALAYTAQKMIRAVYLDKKGLRDLTATNTTAGFRAGQLTELVAPLIKSKRRGQIAPIASMRVGAKDLYRVFYADGTGIGVYMGKKYPESIPFDLGFNPTCCCSTTTDEDTFDDETQLVGSDDGWVYQMDVGTSFDGVAVRGYCFLPFNHAGSPALNKVWSGFALECRAPSGVQFSLTMLFDYGDPASPPDAANILPVQGGGGLWDNDLWDNFVFDAPIVSRAECDIEGIGPNAAGRIITGANRLEQPATLTGAWGWFKPRGLVKRKVA